MTASPCTVVPLPADLDLSKLAFEVPNTKKAGQTGHWRNAIWPELVTPYNQPIKTLQDVWASGLAIDPNAPCLGWRRVISTNPVVLDNKYSWLSYGEVDRRVRNLGATLHHWTEIGKIVKAEGGLKTIGIWSVNRPEWQIIALATQNYGLVSVSLYDTLGADSVQFIMNHAELSVIFCTLEKIPEILRIASKLSALKVIVSIDDLSDAIRPLLQAWGKDRGVEITELKNLEAWGKKNPHDFIPALSTQVTTICYTSGTTGNPKGVLITHGALAVATVANLHGNSFHKGGAVFSYLPLAHIYARFAELLAFAMGVPVGYFSGDTLRLLEDAQILKPVYFVSVPRVLNRIYAGAAATLAGGGFKATLLQKAIDAKLHLLHTTGSTDHLLWDKLVFRKIRALLGGNVKMIASGSAPIAADVLDFLKIAFGGDVLEGYGMTENCGTCLKGYGIDHRGGGTCGPPQICNEIKLVDVPEMGYTSLDKPYPRGELCGRGYNNTIGYYKDPENTRKALDADGWLHSGDVATIDSAGRVAIIDRVKNIMKLSQGEYVALEKIENVYSSVGLLVNTFVYGDSLRDHLVAIVVPDPVALVDLAQRLDIAKDVKPTDIAGLDKIIADPKIYTELMNAMDAAAKKAGLKGFEMVKRVHISNEIFTSDNGMLTPTFKLKRREATIKFRRELDSLYESKL